MDTTTTIQKQKQVDRSGLHKINPETDTPYISIIVPAYNEAQNLDILIREIKQVMAEHRYGYEIIVINDGSTDNSSEILDKLAETEKN